MNFPEIFRPDQDSVGTSGLVLFGADQALTFVRDANTDSYPHFVDLAGGGKQDDETPFATFQRELKEEFGLDVEPDQITYAVRGPSLLGPPHVGWFVVAAFERAAQSKIVFGNEGESYQITDLRTLLSDERLIPQRRLKIQDYLEHMQSEQEAAA